MREIRQSGSEGGAGQTNVPFLPLSLKRRSAAETWGMRDDAPLISRLARPLANPWRVNLWLDPRLKRSRHHGAPLPSPRASEGGTVVSTVKDTRAATRVCSGCL